ncbi:MAG: STAS domain-containing protein [Lachnospiraceae bacterium]|nr:STAS domain-containing protein [Lachnospiraceae bacterium]
MDFEKSDNGECLKVLLVGELDAVNAPELEQCLRDEILGVKRLEFDLKELEYVSSAGLRVFLCMQKIMNAQGSMIIRNVNEEVMSIFQVSGFTKLLNIE